MCATALPSIQEGAPSFVSPLYEYPTAITIQTA